MELAVWTPRMQLRPFLEVLRDKLIKFMT